MFLSLLTSESERSTLLLLESQELVTAAPESGLCLSISSHGFSSFFLDLGPGLYFGTAGGDDFFSILALASYFYQAILYTYIFVTSSFSIIKLYNITIWVFWLRFVRFLGSYIFYDVVSF